ncbi:hypothetical protein KKG82_04255 [Patescibacteria group bacterium]|nr:hypothetical protein [Patescibacteria group bacterium]
MNMDLSFTKIRQWIEYMLDLWRTKTKTWSMDALTQHQEAYYTTRNFPTTDLLRVYKSFSILKKALLDSQQLFCALHNDSQGETLVLRWSKDENYVEVQLNTTSRMFFIKWDIEESLKNDELLKNLPYGSAFHQSQR